MGPQRNSSGADVTDVTTKSISGLESLVDQIPAIAENDSGVFSGSGAGSHPNTPRSVQLPGVRVVLIPLRSTLQQPLTISIQPPTSTPARDLLYQEGPARRHREQVAQPMKLVQTIILQRTFLLIP